MGRFSRAIVWLSLFVAATSFWTLTRPELKSFESSYYPGDFGVRAVAIAPLSASPRVIESIVHRKRSRSSADWNRSRSYVIALGATTLPFVVAFSQSDYVYRPWALFYR